MLAFLGYMDLSFDLFSGERLVWWRDLGGGERGSEGPACFCDFLKLLQVKILNIFRSHILG